MNPARWVVELISQLGCQLAAGRVCELFTATLRHRYQDHGPDGERQRAQAIARSPYLLETIEEEYREVCPNAAPFSTARFPDIPVCRRPCAPVRRWWARSCLSNSVGLTCFQLARRPLPSLALPPILTGLETASEPETELRL